MDKLKTLGIYKISNLPSYTIGVHHLLEMLDYDLLNLYDNVLKYDIDDYAIIFYCIHKKQYCLEIVYKNIEALRALDEISEKIDAPTYIQYRVELSKAIIDLKLEAIKFLEETYPNHTKDKLQLMLLEYFKTEIAPYGNIRVKAIDTDKDTTEDVKKNLMT